MADVNSDLAENRRPYQMTLADFMGSGQVRADIEVSHDDFCYIPENTLDWESRIPLSEAAGTDDGVFSDYALVGLKNRRGAVLLFRDGEDDWVAVGQYAAGSVNIVPAHRGHGLSPWLIIFTAEMLDGSPNPEGDYTNVGYAAHRAAHRESVSRALACGETVPPEVLADYPEFTAHVRQPIHR